MLHPIAHQHYTGAAPCSCKGAWLPIYMDVHTDTCQSLSPCHHTVLSPLSPWLQCMELSGTNWLPNEHGTIYKAVWRTFNDHTPLNPGQYAEAVIIGTVLTDAMYL